MSDSAYSKLPPEQQAKIRAANRAWHKRNKQRRSEYNRAWREANKESIKRRSLSYRAKNKQAIARRDRLRHESKREYRLWIAAKQRARSAGIPFNLELHDIVIPARCPVFGLELKIARGRMNKNSPTLDRIDPAKGYTRGNVAVISYHANRLKNDASADQHRRIAEWIEWHMASQKENADVV